MYSETWRTVCRDVRGVIRGHTGNVPPYIISPKMSPRGLATPLRLGEVLIFSKFLSGTGKWLKSTLREHTWRRYRKYFNFKYQHKFFPKYAPVEACYAPSVRESPDFFQNFHLDRAMIEVYVKGHTWHKFSPKCPPPRRGHGTPLRSGEVRKGNDWGLYWGGKDGGDTGHISIFNTSTNFPQNVTPGHGTPLRSGEVLISFFVIYKALSFMDRP